MKEQFDKDLAKKIKDSFRNYEEPYDPKAWEKLSKAYFKPRKNLWALYWPFITSGLAASLALAVLLWPGQEDRKSTTQSFSDSTAPFPEPLPKADIEPHSDAQDKNGGLAENAQRKSSTEQSRKEPKQEKGTLPTIEKRNVPNGLALKGEVKTQLLDFEIEQTLNEEEISNQIQHRFQIEERNWLTERKSDFQARDTLNQTTKRSTIMDQQEALEMMEKWKNLAENKEETGFEKSPLPFKLGLLVAPQSSSNPVSGMNLGAGVMSEFSLSRKIKLDVGVTYARQSMNPENQQTMPQTMDMAMVRTNSNFLNASYQLDFASLDIPINIKYQVMENQNSGFYLITGLSSMVYLNQQATESFQTNSFFTTEASGYMSFSPSVQEFSTVITPQAGENNLDLGRMINLSVGYEYSLSDGMFISLEPFYKLPLGSLTFANQQFSIGGLNLRMNFKMGK
ncbi:outer membrane beta-barrel protein [Pleomorphovibrio marinus]|uniref:outer membrane beta-barrel protein n=1 Tax=Pleomorphovibrio marinus TaxID=2164132 RepID=UPI000E0CA005|nr:outer membrane beta-barrel protein [Pleomorphovibrio marinus]